MGYSHGPSTSRSALYQGVINSPSGMGSWGAKEGMKVDRLPIHLNIVRRDIVIQERI